jgi:glycyl-tRNA synthetase
LTVREALDKKIILCEWQAFFMAMAKRLLVELGVPVERQRFIEKLVWEKAHYSSQSFDQEVLVERWGWVEVSGHAYRTDYDLSCHMKASGVDLSVYKEYDVPVEREGLIVKPVMAKFGPAFKGDASQVALELAEIPVDKVVADMDKDGYVVVGNYKVFKDQVEISRQKIVERGARFIPHVVEPSFGCDRLFYVALEYAYKVKDDRVILSFPRCITPIQVGIYPLMSKDGLDVKALELQKELTQAGFMTDYDEAGSIGRRYARADEAGVALGITVDYDTLSDDTVTIRDRDSWQQVRVSIKDLPELLRKYFAGEIGFELLGEIIQNK